MSLWSRFSNVFRGDRLNGELEEELQSHIAEALDRGRDPDEARRAFGAAWRHREQSRDLKLIPWLDSLRADGVFAWRQLIKRKVTSAAAILSLALGIGACTSAFRLIDALLLRPLPIVHPERVYEVYRDEIGFDGKPGTFDGWAYPAFLQMRDAVAGQAELIAISYAEYTDLTFRSDQDMEKAYVQYVSGRLFPAFGLRPALGNTFADGPHAYAVISHDYWAHRFAADPRVIGRTFQMGTRLWEIIGVAPEGFTGTEPGKMVDVFLPAEMNPSAVRSDSTWHRTLAILKPGVDAEPIRQRVNAISLAFEQARAKGFTNMSPQSIANYLHQTVRLAPAPSGVSDMQNENRRSLIALGVLVALVLLIACANVANLMSAQAAARAREMALRVSIGAGRWRLIQMLLVECAGLAFAASAIGAIFAWWSAPVVLDMINSSASPARLLLPADWRVLGFGLALTAAVMLLFGIGPALRASSVKPASALKGGDDPHARRRLMHGLIAMQVAFCFLVLFVAGLFVATFDRLAHQPTGFSADRILVLDTVAARKESPEIWEQVAEHLRSVREVEKVALASRALLGGDSWNDSVSIDGGPPSDDLAYYMNVSPGWMDTMRIPLIAGRDFRPGDRYPGTAIVNETFAKRYYPGRNPIGRTFVQTMDEGGGFPLQIVGIAADSSYRSIREPVLAVVYVPWQAERGKREAAIVVRTSNAKPLSLASVLRREVPLARSEFRVSDVAAQQDINDSQTVRERLLAMLAMFFGGVALLLAGVGLYGVLDYSVQQRRREIGIRIAIGARPARIARLVTAEAFVMVAVGAIGGVALGRASVRYIESLLFEVKPTSLGALTVPTVVILSAALLASLPALIRAVRIDPAATLRAD